MEDETEKEVLNDICGSEKEESRTPAEKQAIRVVIFMVMLCSLLVIVNIYSSFQRRVAMNTIQDLKERVAELHVDNQEKFTRISELLEEKAEFIDAVSSLEEGLIKMGDALTESEDERLLVIAEYTEQVNLNDILKNEVEYFKNRKLLPKVESSGTSVNITCVAE